MSVIAESSAASTSAAAPAAAAPAAPSASAPPPPPNVVAYDPIDPEAGPRVILVALDGTEFSVARAIICGSKDGVTISIASQYIRDMIGDDAPTSDEAERVDVRVYANVTEKVVKFVEFHAKEPMEEIKRPLELQYKDSFIFDDSISKFDQEFINTDIEMLFRLCEAGNYLNIQALTSLTHAKIMSLIKNKSRKEIQDLFGPYMGLTVTGM